MKPVRVVFAVALLTGCAGLIGVPDLTFDEKAEQGTPDGSATSSSSGSSGSTTNDGSTTADGGDAAINCDQSLLQTDKLNCGRCGHDCLGADCVAGVCKAAAIGTIAGNAPLNKIVEHTNALYVSTIIGFTTQTGGIWKVPKATGNPAPFVTLRYAEEMAVIGDTLYFVVADDKYVDGGATTGGLYSCDLNGPTPCVPQLVYPADNPGALSVGNGGKVYFTDGANTGNGAVMEFTPPSKPPTIFRPGFGFPPAIWVDKQDLFYLTTIFNDPQHEALWNIMGDGGEVEVSDYTKKNQASTGQLTGSGNALYFTGWDYQVSTGGVVRRISRPGSVGVAPCDFGGIKNKRPYGIYLDTTNIYWANQGEPAEPYPDGSIATCPLDGCCTDPTTLWTGDGEPSAVTGDATGLYWVTYRKAEIWKMAKP